MTISDGHLSLPMAFLYPDVPKEELEPFLVANGLPANVLTPDCNVTAFKRGDRVVLFDVGSGSNFMKTAGRLGENLAEAGIDPASVTDVVFTHAHPDHLWGVTDDFDELVFPSAAYHISQTEWDFWSSAETLTKVPPERQSFVVGAQSRFKFIEDKVNFIKPGQEVLSGVEAVDTAGHTPGHLSFLVHGGSEPTLIIGDALSNTAISFAHPEWRTGSDHDQEMGAKTRAALLDRLAGDKVTIIGYHFNHTGIGHAERRGSAYAFIPA
ncbi:MBL fold metallo-hydrolase [Ciceribacter naphthalenivorans]|uniref:MBL fold metallo-hydrolase n=3 Tax=Pseudomonadota TaxID=1224 RepID=A0A512HIK5_9HYPH|nr:MBL fold metallo-hydrolase [Ciceribacter naphthalenivorans]GLR20903.1 MBL fold metallo-hydrolase [Ciceribacter naphthalenivorans]GLT03759.1 MBL fold metallo-hydrolase [Sphingomonas psychrolutea]